MRIGILLINLGTPDAPDRRAVRRYLGEFLSDPRVIERRGPLWWLILNGVILPRRTGKSARAYDLIWDRAHDDSPLRVITRAQARKLGQAGGDECPVLVDWAMRYGRPSIGDALHRLTRAGCDRVLVFPLYPQYSGATTGSALDRTYDALRALRHQPSLRIVPPYFADPGYIAALAQSIRAHARGLDRKPQRYLASFHGLPQAFIDAGDPYRDQCETTLDLLRRKLGMDSTAMPLVYQSRGRGRAVWLGPQLEETLIALAGDGVRDVCVFTPGFAADCIETLEEVQIRAAQSFRDHGGRRFSFVPCLNDSDAAIALMQARIRANTRGWD